ncbi:zincin-like metallopeptidase domain-containing protein, partial [Bradyrhizobium sp. S3.2.12]|uniref:zincin-like metallopeptidase domain-containing protein n=1 Tax=Bradyrhizobium sp. S3.2.12 TaxID=3156387 RepID=UPI0033951472
EDYAEWDWRDHAANRAQPSRCGIIWIAALCALCRYRHNGHWTGHPNRLNRDLTGTFGSKPYAHEELVAELTAAFVCAALSIKPTVRHADYLGSWLDVLRSDSRAIFRAASKASKAADFLLAFSEDNRAAAAKARAP